VSKLDDIEARMEETYWQRAKELIEKYSDVYVQQQIEKLEKQGYTVNAGPDGCQIYDRNDTMIIDADFFHFDFFLNAAHALEGFYELKKENKI
jgi:hypothetical protein